MPPPGVAQPHEEDHHDVNELVERAILAVKASRLPPSGEGNVKVIRRYGRNTWIMCVGHEIRAVFVNLLHNSFDAFGDRGGTVTVSTARRGPPPGRETDEVTVTVTDDGEGIAADRLRQLETDGYTTRVGPNRGNGLSICRKYVSGQGGTIKITSPGPGKGTRVSVTLPAERPDSP
jgi:signal transduction histidine kinase